MYLLCICYEFRCLNLHITPTYLHYKPSPKTCLSRPVKNTLLQPERYDSLLAGETVTTGPSSGIMSLPRGVRTCSLNRAPQSCYQERRHVCGALSQTPQRNYLPTISTPVLNQCRLPSPINQEPPHDRGNHARTRHHPAIINLGR